MAIRESSGYIGLGSRLFLSKEATWGTKANNWELYNVYNQEGGRPQKVTTPIEVSQLYPSMLRRKPIKNSTSVEGGFTFSLPTTGFDPFAQLITGDTPSGGSNLPITAVITSEGDANRLMFTLETAYTVGSSEDATISNLVGKTISVAGVTTDASEGEDDEELANYINRQHVVLYHDHDTTNTGETGNPGLGFPTKVVVETTFEIDQLNGALGENGQITFDADYDLQQVVATSYSFAQSISTHQIALYTGMMAQSTTFNVSPDDVANCEITFLGKDEVLYDPTDDNATTVFGATNTHLVTDNNGTITQVGGNYDNCTEFYPSWSTTLYINRKDPSDVTKFQFPSNAGWSGSNANFVTSEAEVPFSDLSITINNNLEFPAYLNGTKTRNKPVQTTYKEVTGSITIPYNEYTDYIVASMFDQDSFEFRILFEIDGSSIKLTLPEVCIIGDSLADIPAGEMTLPINFGAYASKSGNNYSQAISPFKIAVVD